MTEDRLERALGGWAATGGIEERERERMRMAILLTPEVDALWWDRFNQQMARLAARAQERTARRAAAPTWGVLARVSWGAGA